MPERMDEPQARVWLLRALNQRVAESRDAGEDVLELRTPDFEGFGQAMGWTTPAVSALYKRLVRGGFVRQVNDEKKFVEIGGMLSYAWVEDLTDDGLRAIEVLPDPHERLAEALQAFAEAVQELPDVPQEEKDRAEGAAQELKTFARGLAPNAAIELVKVLAASMGAPLP